MSGGTALVPMSSDWRDVLDAVCLAKLTAHENLIAMENIGAYDLAAQWLKDYERFEELFKRL